MGKSNNHKKDYQEDKFSRAYYCQHAWLNQLREDKRQSEKKPEEKIKNFCKTY